jgi:hypothetical protein
MPRRYIVRGFVSVPGTVKDNLGATHEFSFDLAWTAVGPLITTVNPRKQEAATLRDSAGQFLCATARVWVPGIC